VRRSRQGRKSWLRIAIGLFVVSLGFACKGSSEGAPSPTDGGGVIVDAGVGEDAGVDAGADSGAVTDAGTDAGAASDAGLDAGVAITSPKFYFVVHADPAVLPTLNTHWSNLVRFFDDLAARNAGLSGEPHRVTVMFTPNWGKLISQDGVKKAKIAAWVDAGHEMAFHSHTHVHAQRDGFTNATAAFGPDDWSLCWGDAGAGECTTSYGVTLVQTAMNQAVGGTYPFKWGAIGPKGNGGTPSVWGANDNTCNPARDAQDAAIADTSKCIDAEWVGAVNTVLRYQTDGYPGVTESMTADPNALRGSSFCVRTGEAAEDIYSMPHAPYETESGSLKVTLSTTEAAINASNSNDFVSVVIHPGSYEDTGSVSYDGGRRERILAVFDFLDSPAQNTRYPVRSRTLSQVREVDTDGGGIACKDSR
jgi:hypothetical protein